MKKVMMFAAIAAALASCHSRGNQNIVAAEDSITVAMAPMVEDVTEVYEGTLPAADGAGIDYVLTLNAATNGTDTTFTLDMTYLDADKNGKEQKFRTNGKKQTIQKVVNNKPTKAMKLSPDNGEDPIYFVIVNDTTLRLSNDSLQEAVSNLNYDIIKVK